MPLRGPNTEDQRKIHAEINQLVNQRFLLTTSAITAFFVIITWMLPKSRPVAGDSAEWLFVAAAVLSIVLCSIAWVSHSLRGLLRVFTSYLAETRVSNWELDWAAYRDVRYWGYTKSLTLLFLVLNGVDIVFPFLIAHTQGVPLGPRVAWRTAVLVFGVTEVFIFGIGFYGWFDREADAAKRWRELNTEGLTSLRSPHDITQTAARLAAALSAKGQVIVSRIDHKQEADSVGIRIRPTISFLFRNPPFEAALVQENQQVAVEFPSKMVVWEDVNRNVWLSYTDPIELASRYGIGVRDPAVLRLASVAAEIAAEAIAP